MQKITESTLLPMSLLGSIIAVAYWLSGIENLAKAGSRATDKLEMQFRSAETLREQRDREIIERLSRIETMLERKK